jgi:hypothetical protein
LQGVSQLLSYRLPFSTPPRPPPVKTRTFVEDQRRCPPTDSNSPIEAICKHGGMVIMIKRPATKPAKFKWDKLGEFLYHRFGLMLGVERAHRPD